MGTGVNGVSKTPLPGSPSFGATTADRMKKSHSGRVGGGEGVEFYATTHRGVFMRTGETFFENSWK